MNLVADSPLTIVVTAANGLSDDDRAVVVTVLVPVTSPNRPSHNDVVVTSSDRPSYNDIALTSINRPSHNDIALTSSNRPSNLSYASVFAADAAEGSALDDVFALPETFDGLDHGSPSAEA